MYFQQYCKGIEWHSEIQEFLELDKKQVSQMKFK